MSDTDKQQPEGPQINLVAWWSTIIGLCLVIAFGSIFITRAYLERRDYEVENWRPPYRGKLEKDLTAINRDGKEVNLGSLKHKIFVAAYQYTDCPAGCLGTAAYMKQLLDQFGSDERFHLVSISVDPDSDTPEKMDAWVKDKGVKDDRWWFLTGDKEKIQKYMLSEFMFQATEEITDPAERKAYGPWAHDQRLCIVDELANVRGYYDVMNAQRGDKEYERMVIELKMILNPKLKLSDLIDTTQAQQ